MSVFIPVDHLVVQLAFEHMASGVSLEAESIREQTRELSEQPGTSESYYDAKARCYDELNDVALECNAADWDGYDALPVPLEAVINAQALVRALPDDIPMPEIAPEPDGAISLDWVKSRHELVSVSVDDGDRLPYAWLDGTDKGHAVARFDGERVPDLMLACIRAVLNG